MQDQTRTRAVALALLGLMLAAALPTVPVQAEVCTPPVPDPSGEPAQPICEEEPPVCEDGVSVDGACGHQPPEPCNPIDELNIDDDWEPCPDAALPCPPQGSTIEAPEDCQPLPDACEEGCDLPCDPDTGEGCDAQPCDGQGGPCDPCEGTATTLCGGECEGDSTVCEPCQDGAGCDVDPCQGEQSPCEEDPCQGAACDPCPGDGAENGGSLPDQNFVEVNDGFLDGCVPDPCEGQVGGACGPCGGGGRGNATSPEIHPAAPDPTVAQPSMEGIAQYWMAVSDDVNLCNGMMAGVPLVPFYADLGAMTADPGNITWEGSWRDCYPHHHTSGVTHWDFDFEVVAYFQVTKYRGDLPGGVAKSEVVFRPDVTRVVLSTHSGSHTQTQFACELEQSEEVGQSSIAAIALYDVAQREVDYSGNAIIAYVAATGSPPYLVSTGRMNAACLELDHDYSLPTLPYPWAWEGFFPHTQVPQLDAMVSVYGRGESLMVRPSSEVGTGVCLSGANLLGP